jgi:uncharacterized protein YbjQ (UPF0145 family)
MIPMILTTTLSIENRAVSTYLGIVGAEVIFGSNFIRDWFAQGTDFIGGRSTEYEGVYQAAREKALIALEGKADVLHADAVLGIRFDYQVLGAKNGMLMVAATGTAVNLSETLEKRVARKRAEREEEPHYFVPIDGRERGPFSIAQLRELLTAGNIIETTTTRREGRPNLPLFQLLEPIA